MACISLAMILFVIANTARCVQKNVCSTYKDYKTINSNPNCWQNPDLGDSPEQIVSRYGFSFKNYEIQTKDGYILTLFRLFKGTTAKKSPVLFQQGLASDADLWMTLGAESIVFVFADAGYDVWISNNRGTKYSQKHTTYTINDADYWNFSFDEMALVDLPAILEFIVEKTEQRGNITYVGHTTGTTVAYIYASLKSQHAASCLRSVISLAPTAYMSNIRSEPIKLVAIFRDVIQEVFNKYGIYGIGPNIQSYLDLVHRSCSTYPFISVCAWLEKWIQSTNDHEMLAPTYPLIITAFPSGISLKNFVHLCQLVITKNRFQHYDYGTKENLKVYNSAIPPEYPLDQIKVPVHIFYGNNDGLTGDKDVMLLYNNLTSEKTLMKVYDFGHIDYFGSPQAILFHKNLLNYLP